MFYLIGLIASMTTGSELTLVSILPLLAYDVATFGLIGKLITIAYGAKVITGNRNRTDIDQSTKA